MSRYRFFILLLGPIGIVSILYWATMPRPARSGITAKSPELPPQPSQPAASRPDASWLLQSCHEESQRLTETLGPECEVIVRPPYVLAGNLSSDELDTQYREIIVPTARALSTMYFDQTPDQPITIVMLRTAQSYGLYAELLDGRKRANYAGYYQRSSRRIVLNAATGGGTLSHELTHALAHFDFPVMPEWFDEGLASLYEECEFSNDGLRLIGLPNWRMNYLLPAIRRNRLQTLESLMSAVDVRSEHEAVDYAYARALCLYLQEQRLLGYFYRKFRARVDSDPTGVATLRELLQETTLAETDRRFRNWALSLSPGRSETPTTSRQQRTD